MRIVSGRAGGRHIATPEGNDVRPTKDRVREAVFNSLHSFGEIEDRVFGDLFAGSGALGLEALSRGARSCTFIDNDRSALTVVTRNVSALEFNDRSVIRMADSFRDLALLGPFDVALLDPPYSFDAWKEFLAAVPSEVVVIESDHQVDPGIGWEILKAKQYASTVVVIARRVHSGE